MQPPTLTRRSFEHRGFGLSFLDTDPQATDKATVLLLHGFPDSAQMWREVIAPLHTAGYRCVAPDTLGCGESALGLRTRDYRARDIASDHAALLQHLRIDRAHVVGHDWGAAVGWFLAAYHPERVSRLVPISVGHPTAYARAEFRQKIMGWYILFFQLVGLSERLLPGSGRFSLARVVASHPDMDEVVESRSGSQSGCPPRAQRRKVWQLRTASVAKVGRTPSGRRPGPNGRSRTARTRTG